MKSDRYDLLELRDCKFGKGVFAKQDIPFGTRLIRWEGLISEEDLMKIKDQVDPDHTCKLAERLYALPTEGLDNYVNHHCEPNAGLREEDDGFYMYPMRDIKQGEQLYWDYSISMDKSSLSLFPEWVMECSCDSAHCRKTIGPFEWLPAEVRKRYIEMDMVPTYFKKFL